MNAFVIDAFDFCRRKERQEGEIAIADLPRLAAESVDRSGSIRWCLQGGSNSLGHLQMVLSVAGSVQLMCQRCLAPFAFDIQSETMLVLAKDEGGADEIDSLLDDDSIEVIVGSNAFNVMELVEDEVLLLMPLAPKHDVCPEQLVSSASKDVQSASPFAVLKNLKQ
jgi:uncharacterized protein